MHFRYLGSGIGGRVFGVSLKRAGFHRQLDIDKLMKKSTGFSFGDSSVAGAYQEVLVPILFEPWAQALVEMNESWQGSCVLDLATGTGIVAQLLAKEVGTSGSVTGMDMNQQMLDIAVARAESQTNLKFVLCPAEKLDCQDSSFDYVVCQQGFQFFSDRNASAAEIFRALREGGTTLLSIWRPVSECHFFGAICKSLEDIDEHEISQMMRAPFDFLPISEVVSTFESAGFSTIQVKEKQQGLIMSGGVEQAVKAAYATPIGPKLRSLPEEAQVKFKNILITYLKDLDGDSMTIGEMAADILIAVK
jgi:ubiquinone/menaquinone biosynthesis C-methylase UbiE